MHRLVLLFLCSFCAFAQAVQAPPSVDADAPLRELRTLMCERGDAVYHDDFDAHSPPAWGGWSAGEWTSGGGILRAAYTGGHPIYHQHILRMKDSVVQMSFRFDDGVDYIGIGWDGGPKHVLRANLHRTSVDLQRMEGVGKTGNDQMDSVPVKLDAGKWYTMMMEQCGTEVLVTIDESILLYGNADGIDCDKVALILTGSPTATKFASFAHCRVWQAKPKADWARKREQVLRVIRQKSGGTPEAVAQVFLDDSGRSLPVFLSPSAHPKVARVETQIAGGGVSAGSKALEKLAGDKDAATAAAATASLAVVSAWKQAMDGAIAERTAAGDIYGAAETASTLAGCYSGEAGKPYRDQAAELKKDPAYAAGKEFQKLAAATFATRRDPAFANQIAAFLKKHPDGFYASLAPGLVTK